MYTVTISDLLMEVAAVGVGVGNGATAGKPTNPSLVNAYVRGLLRCFRVGREIDVIRERIKAATIAVLSRSLLWGRSAGIIASLPK